LRETIRPSGGPSPISASGPARGAPGHRGHCRVGPAEQFRPTGGRVMAFSGDSEAMDQQPGQRQCDGQQQPGPQPGRQENPHAQRPLFFPPGGRALAARHGCTGLPTAPSCASAALPTTRWRTAGHVPSSSPLPPARHANHYAGEADPRALRGMSMTSCSSLAAGQDGDQDSASAATSSRAAPPHPTRRPCCQVHLARPRP
jgi:hypothetical protein